MKYSDIINQMTIEEKCAYVSGKNEWATRSFKVLGIEALHCSDGPNGVRRQKGDGDHLGLNPSVPATCFPPSATLANSWDEDLLTQVGEGLGAEAACENVDVLLGPGMNIKRNPLCGRNFEYFSEDPYLSGKCAAAVIRGVQSYGVSACAKHYAVNSQELRRMAMNALVDERTLREMYTTAFEIAVKEGKVKAVMSSYNQVNGVYANENKHLLMDILRDDFGFDGAVITDWGGSNDHALGVKNGSTLEMPAPGLDSARELLQALKKGIITQADIDARVDELLHLTFSTRDKKIAPDQQALFEKNHALARLAAGESAILLKNTEDILPLQSKKSVAIIGDFAFKPRYQGAGSSMVNSTKVDTIVDLLDTTELAVVGKGKGYSRDGKEDEVQMVAEAVSLAAKADIVLYFFGLNEDSESEGMDRTHMRIPQNQINLLQELVKVNQNIVGIISAGSAIEMPWHHHFKALLHTYLWGQAGAGAILDILIGKINPSGKLTETIIKKYEDTPSFAYYPSSQRNAEYRESIYIGYRYFEKVEKDVLYPFGFGLSYTQFAYENLVVGDTGVRFSIKNIGTKDGAEIAQLYIGLPDAKVFRAKKELKGFKKVFLKPGESREVEISFDDKSFRYWNVATDAWEVEEGSYEISIGTSSADIVLRAMHQVAGTTDVYPYASVSLPSYDTGKITGVGDVEYETLYGKTLPNGSWSGELERNDALCQMYYAKSGLARFLYKVLDNRLKKAASSGVPDLNTLFQYNMPFRAIAKMSAGIASMEMVDAILVLVNGHFFKGMGGLISGYFKNKKLNKAYESKYLTREDKA